MHIAALIERYGYVVLFVLVGLESVGVPMPGETALLTAAAFAAAGRLHIALVIVVAAAGAILGDNGGYWIGRRGGIALARRYGRLVRLDASRLERAHAFFERHGAPTVFFGRFIALLRTWAALLAGVGEMRYATFMLYNALGGVAWAGVYGAIGYLFGRNLARVERWIGDAGWWLAGAVAAGIVAYVLWRRITRAPARPR